MIPIYTPNISNYTGSALSAIQSGWISNHGEFINKSTDKLQTILNVKHVILMANGTCATHCLFLSLKYKYPSLTKIYIPNNCYVAAWNMLFEEYSREVVEVMKMDMNTWNINTDEEYILSLEPNSAMLIVHNLGNIVNVPRLKRLRPDIIFVEDNCEGLFGKYEGGYSGTSEHTLCSAVSFYGNKIITTGEGGAFMTNDDDLFEYISKVYSQGMSYERYLHDTHAYNYRMTNVAAAFLYDQLNDIDNILRTKAEVFANYYELLQPLIQSDKIRVFVKEDNTECANWIFAVRIMNNARTKRELYNYFVEKGVDIRPFFYPINMHGHLKDIQVDDDVAMVLNKEIIMIPSSPGLTMEEQKHVVKLLRELVDMDRYSIRNVLVNGVFDLIPRDLKFDLDNEYYGVIRNSVSSFIGRTLSEYENKIILEIGPKKNMNERIVSDRNIIETVDIVSDNNTTYVADLTRENILPKNYFDVIYCLEVLEHTYEPWKIIEEMYHLLKPEGTLHISMPFQFRLHGPLPDCYRISEMGIKHLLETNGYKITHFETTVDNDRPAFPVHYTVSCVKQT